MIEFFRWQELIDRFGDREYSSHSTSSIKLVDVFALAQQMIHWLGPAIAHQCIDDQQFFVLHRVADPIEQIAAFVACSVVGAVYAPLSPYLGPDQLQANLRQIPQNYIWLESGLANVSATKNPKKTLFDQNIARQRPALLIFTSGVTGAAKGVVLSLDALLRSSDSTKEHFKLGHDQLSILHSLPAHHIGGFMIALRSLLWGARLVGCYGESLDGIKQPVDLLSIVPTQLFRLLHQPKIVAELSDHGLILLGGGLCHPDLLNQAHECGLRLSLTYGSSETCAVCLASPIAPTSDVVYPLPGREVKVEEGQLMIHRATCFLGYWRDRCWQQPFDQDGYFASGDEAEALNSGLKILGRQRLIKCGGKKLSLNLLEKSLQEFWQHRVLVTTSWQPSSEWGQKPIVGVYGSSSGQTRPSLADPVDIVHQLLPRSFGRLDISWIEVADGAIKATL